MFSHQVLEPEMLMAAIRDADLEPCQLSAGPMPSTVARVSCPRVCLDLASFGPALLFTGAMPRDCYTVVFVSACPGGGRSFNFSLEHSDGYVGFFPPGGLLDAYTPEGYANATLTVPGAVFEDALERHFPEIPESILARGAGMPIGSATQVRLRSLIAAIEGLIKGGGRDLARAGVCRHLECDLLTAFIEALRSGCGRHLSLAGTPAGPRQRRLLKVRDFVADRLHQPLRLDDLCAEAGLSVRGTENLFRDHLGVTPIVFLRQLRLHKVRRILLGSEPVSGTVKKAAIEMGFWHLGHFARDYRRLFGENPSETLAGRH